MNLIFNVFLNFCVVTCAGAGYTCHGGHCGGHGVPWEAQHRWAAGALARSRSWIRQAAARGHGPSGHSPWGVVLELGRRSSPARGLEVGRGRTRSPPPLRTLDADWAYAVGPLGLRLSLQTWEPRPRNHVSQVLAHTYLFLWTPGCLSPLAGRH